MNKRGDTTPDLLLTVGYILIVLVAVGSLVYWIGSADNLVEDQTVAKQAALVLDLAKPGTTIFMDKNVSVEGNIVRVGASSYSLFTKNKIVAEQLEFGGTKVTIENE